MKGHGVHMSPLLGHVLVGFGNASSSLFLHGGEAHFPFFDIFSIFLGSWLMAWRWKC
jgi:hypothetical protein